MPMQNHLTELARKHETLEKELREANLHPSTDDLRVAELKRRKLQLKDELLRLKPAERMAH